MGDSAAVERGGRAAELRRLRQHGRDDVISVGSLLALGVPRSTVYRRCRAEQGWQLLLPGVVLLHAGKPTDEQRLRAAVLYAGPDARVTGLAAARCHGLRRVPDPRSVHVLVPASGHPRSTGFVVIERTTSLPHPVLCDGVPCAPVPRAVLDGARRLRDTDQIRALLAEAVQRGHCVPEQLVAELDAGGQHGSARPRQVLVEVLDGVRSVAESHARRLTRRSGLPVPWWNAELIDGTGRLIATPDAWWPDVRLAWEIDSLDYHFAPEDYRRTVARNARYAAHGIPFLQTVPARLATEPGKVIDELRSAHAAAAARLPPATVTARPVGRVS